MSKILKESFWGGPAGASAEVRQEVVRTALGAAAQLVYGQLARVQLGEKRKDYRNGYYARDFVTRVGTLRLRIARTRKKGFLARGAEKISTAGGGSFAVDPGSIFAGINTRQVGWVVATLTGEVVRAQTVSRQTRDLDALVQQFHRARLEDNWAYLFLDGVSLRVRRPSGRKRVQMLVAYGVKQDGRRQLLAFLRSQGESQADWEGLLNDLDQRGLRGKNLQLIVSDGCPGLAAAIPTVYPGVAHQRCWVHKMRNSWRKCAAATTTP